MNKTTKYETLMYYHKDFTNIVRSNERYRKNEMFNQIYTKTALESYSQSKDTQNLNLPVFESAYNTKWSNITPLKNQLNSTLRADQRYKTQMEKLINNNNTPREPDISISKIATDRANYSSGNYFLPDLECDDKKRRYQFFLDSLDERQLKKSDSESKLLNQKRIQVSNEKPELKYDFDNIKMNQNVASKL